MSKYTLELFNGGGWLPGAESQDFADSNAVRDCAIATIRDLVSSEIREGSQINLAHFISIRDGRGEEVERIAFREAVSFIDPEDSKVAIKG